MFIWVKEVVILCMWSMNYLSMGKRGGVGRESWRRAHAGPEKDFAIMGLLIRKASTVRQPDSTLSLQISKFDWFFEHFP